MAYPGSTVSDVKNALFVADNFDVLTQTAGQSDRDFDNAYRLFLGKVQNKLGRNGSPGPNMT